MQMLTLPALIIACSGSPRADVQDTLYRIAIAHSRGAQLYVYNASTAIAYNQPTAAAAAQIFDQLAVAHHDVHIGLMGLSRHALVRWKITSLQATDACLNIKIASYELNKLLPKRASEDRLHKALAKYWAQANPTSPQAIDWGAMVLHQPRVSVREQAKSSTQLATARYKLKRSILAKKASQGLYKPSARNSLLQKSGQSPTQPQKWINKTPKKSKMSKDKTKTIPKPKPAVLTPKDLAPYHDKGALAPVTDRRL